jgi:drug/metabolite transporter (DMT)-like permease
MSRRGLLLFSAMSLIWGIPYLLIRIAVAEISPATLVLGRTAMATAILLPIALARGQVCRLLGHWPWIVAFAVVEVAIPWVLLGSAEERISSSLAGLLVATVPLVGAALAVATGGDDRPGVSGLVGLLVGLLGVAGIVGMDLRAEDGIALLEMAGVVLGYAIGPAILARRLSDAPAVGVMAVAVALCVLLYLPVVALNPPRALPSPAVLAAVGILGVVCTAVAFVLFAALIAEIGPVRATVITYVNPAVAAILGVLVLGETLTPPMVGGFGLVVLGSLLATTRRPPRSPRTSSAGEGPLGVLVNGGPAPIDDQVEDRWPVGAKGGP